MKISDRIVFNLTRSFKKYLDEEIFSVNSVEKTLLQFYSDPLLKIQAPDFPDLEELSLPAIAVTYLNDGQQEVFYGGKLSYVYRFTLWGFSGGETDDYLNKIQRDMLMSDLKCLVEDGGFTVYDWSGGSMGSELGSVIFDGVSTAKLPRTGNTEADKYRFSVSCSIKSLEEIT